MCAASHAFSYSMVCIQQSEQLSALLGTTILQGLMVSLTHFISNSTAVYCLTTVPCSQKLTISKQ